MIADWKFHLNDCGLKRSVLCHIIPVIADLHASNNEDMPLVKGRGWKVICFAHYSFPHDVSQVQFLSAFVVWNCFDNGGLLQLVKPGCSYLCRAAAQMGTKSEKKYFSAHLVLLLNCFNRRDTTGSLCGRNPFGLNERGAKDCSMQLPIKAELANPLVKQLRQEDRRGRGDL